MTLTYLSPRYGSLRDFVATLQYDKRKILAAVAGGVIPKNVKEFAIKNGLFVIKQSGEAFEIFDPPEGFTPQEW